MAIDPLGTGGERQLGRPQRGLAAEQIERGGAQQTQHGACGMGLQHVTILAQAVVFDVEEAVFDAPLPAAQGQQLLRASLVGGRLVTRARVCVLTSPVATRTTCVVTSAPWPNPGSAL